MLLYVCTVQCTIYMVSTRCQVQSFISQFILGVHMLLYVCTVQCTIYMVGTRCLGAELYFLVYPRSTHVIICM